jgi:NAD(P)-dependent dehydrogenase (short-subunit alcohol dehydrogenase family)
MLALVTGGLTRLGAAIAGRLAADGYALALHARTEGAPEPALARLLADRGTAWHAIGADLARAEDVEALVGRVADRFGRSPDLLVNSASIFGQEGWDGLTRDALDHHMAVNVSAPVMLTAAIARSGGKAVVNVLDQRIANPPLDQAAYTLSKLALGSFTRILARAFAPAMRVNAVAPGLTIPGDDYDAEQVDRLAEMMPLRRLPRPADIADAVAFLARADAVTGQTILVDSGAALESYPRDFVNLAGA